MRIHAIVVVLLVILVVPSTVRAQFDGSLAGSGPTIDVSNVYPEPYSNITVSINDYSTEADNAAISWRVDGTPVTETANQRSISVSIGDAGKPVVVEAVLSLPSGQKMVAKRTIVPHYFDLIVEPQTRVPFFYRGRALPSIGSSINVTALLDAGSIPTSELTYTWSLNNQVLFGGPVRGQNQVTINTPFGASTLDVEARHATRGVLAGRRIELINSTPKLRFYEVSSLYGSAYRPLSLYTLTGNTTTVRAEPYFLDLRTFNTPDFTEWTIGTIPSKGNSNPYEITLVRQNNGQPVSVGFHVRNLSEVLQGAEGSFQVQ